MAKSLGSSGKATRAIEFYNLAISLLESSRGIENKDLIMPLLGLGNMLLQEGKATEAENPFLRLNFFPAFFGWATFPSFVLAGVYDLCLTFSSFPFLSQNLEYIYEVIRRL